MSFDRKIYKVPFSKKSLPEWPCPVCTKGLLEGKKGSFKFVETPDSLKARKIDDWEPDWVRYVYSCEFECMNKNCKATVYNIGEGGVDYEIDFDAEQGFYEIYYDNFKPTYFKPSLKIFNVPRETPIEINQSIQNSFELLFANPASAANQIRIALEQLLDALKVKKYSVSKGRRRPLQLHNRISLIPSKYSDFQDAFYAVKWLGNDGSHPKGVTLDDIFDAYEILEYLLDEIFGKKSQKTKRLVKKINSTRK